MKTWRKPPEKESLRTKWLAGKNRNMGMDKEKLKHTYTLSVCVLGIV